MNEVSPDERGVSPVASKRRLLRSPKARKVAVAAGCLGAVVLAGLGVNAALTDKGPAEKPADTGSSVIAQVTQAPPALPDQAPAKPADPVASTVVYVHDNAAVAAPPAVVSGPVNFVRMPSAGGETSFEVPAPAVRDEAGHEAAEAAAAARDAKTTKVAFKPSVLAGGKAGPAIRLTYVMMPQLIPCALDTAMDSTLAGAITCHTTQDVLSPDHVLLMSAGTQITGTYKNDVRNGQTRLFAFAGSAITKEGIPVPLDSQVADGLGRAGIEATDVNNHYGERFGAGILLTGAEGILGVAQAAVSKGGNTYINLNTGSGASGVATQILQSQINIPPTISVVPGTIVSIVVDHPIDFSDAIKVRTTER
jgi:type IV secretion system protein VirB10